MNDLARVYGHGFAALMWLLVGVWLFALILFPLGMMAEQSMWRLEAPPGAAEVTMRIDQGYNERSVARLDRTAATGAATDALDRKIAALAAELQELESREVRPQRVYGPANYTRMTSAHVEIFLSTLGYASIVTILALIICYPIAFAAATTPSAWRATLMLIALSIPYATNELIRIYALMMILDVRGLINLLLDLIGLVSIERNPIRFLDHRAATFSGLVYAYILFMAFPLYNAFETLERSQIDAARDLGASTWRLHWRVVLPHAKPGVAVGCVTVFILAAGSWSVPQTLSRGIGGDWFTTLIYRQFFEAHNWNIGSAYAVALLVACLVFIALVLRITRVTLRDMMR